MGADAMMSARGEQPATLGFPSMDQRVLGSTPLSGGELNQAITSALVGIHSKYLGRGPESATTFCHDNVVVSLMRGVLTHAERMLSDTNQDEAVNQMRHLFQETMEPDFKEAQGGGFHRREQPRAGYCR
jgi:hypothetical protein